MESAIRFTLTFCLLKHFNELTQPVRHWNTDTAKIFRNRNELIWPDRNK